MRVADLRVIFTPKLLLSLIVVSRSAFSFHLNLGYFSAAP